MIFGSAASALLASVAGIPGANPAFRMSVAMSLAILASLLTYTLLPRSFSTA